MDGVGRPVFSKWAACNGYEYEHKNKWRGGVSVDALIPIVVIV